MINVNVTPNSGGGSGAVKNRDFSIFAKLTDYKKIGLSKRSDGTTDADGTLYPTNFPNEQYTGYIQNQIYNQVGIGNNPNAVDVGKGEESGTYTNNQLKVKVAEAWVNKWKRFKYVKIFGALIAGAQSPALGISGANVNDLGDVVDLGSNKFVLFFTQSTGTTGSYAVVGTVNPSTGAITFGTPVIFSTNTSSAYNGGKQFRAMLLGTDKVAFVYNYNNATSGVYACVLTVSGTTITMGTPVQANVSDHNYGYSICKLATDKFMITYGKYNGGYRQYLRAATVSGTAITFGTEAGGGNEQREGRLYQIGTDKCMLVSVANNTGQNYYNYVEIITTSGTTITENSNSNLQQNSPYANNDFEAVELTTNKWLFFGGYTYQSYRNIVVFDTSGTTIARLNETYASGFGGSIKRGFLRSYSSGIGIVDFYSESGSATLTVDANNGVSSVFGTSITGAVPLSGGNWGDIIFGKVGTAIIAFHKQNPVVNTVKYSYSGTVIVELYNDATIIGSANTLGMALGTSLISADVAVNQEKAYLGIKNVSGASAYLSVSEVLMEAS